MAEGGADYGTQVIPGHAGVEEVNRSRIVPNPGLTLLYSLHFLADHVLIGAYMVIALGA
jgi:hypothetical protein